MRVWQHGLFGCFDNIGICIITYFIPCYTFGKNAETTGEDCILCGILYAIFPIDLIVHFMIRQKIREMRYIDGSPLEDLLTVLCCWPCALCQEAQEVENPVVYGWWGMARE